MGPLSGVKVIEFAGVGPGPFCGMLLSDMGAEVIRIDRKRKATAVPGDPAGTKFDVLARGKKSIMVDMKTPEGVALCLDLVAKADAVIEGYRPGVMERLGLGPDVCLARNPKLVYGRITGWGQTGPLAHTAGHDLNYIALTGALHAIGLKGGRPVPPLNLVGDFGGGGAYLAIGMLAALFEASRSGKGQVIDAAMTEGATSLMAMIYGFAAMGTWSNKRGGNVLDSGAFFYDTYETADGKWLSIAPVEPNFFALLREKLDLTSDPAFDNYMHPKTWAAGREKLDALFRTKTLEAWCQIFDGTDACVAPVLAMQEAKDHPHMKARQAIVEVDGVPQPNVAPRFSRTIAEIQGPPPQLGGDTEAVLRAFGLGDKLEELRSVGAV